MFSLHYMNYFSIKFNETIQNIPVYILINQLREIFLGYSCLKYTDIAQYPVSDFYFIFREKKDSKFIHYLFSMLKS